MSDVPVLRLKRPLSDTPGARHSREHRKRAKKGVRMERVPVGHKDLDAFKRAGYLNESEENAAAAAVRMAVDAWTKLKQL